LIALQQGIAAKGINTFEAKQGALKLMEGSVTRQAAVLSYMDVFLYVGMMFLICIPFVIMAKGKKPAVKIEMGDVH